MNEIIWKEVDAIAKADPAQLVFESEKYFTNQVEAVARGIFDIPELRIVLIAGPSSSGKTTFCKLLSEQLERNGVRAHRISMDDFFIDRDKVPILPSGLKDYDGLDALDLEELNRVIRGVLQSEWVELPEYNFVTGKSTRRVNLLRLHKEDVVLIEGIHALNPLPNKGIDMSRICRIGIKPRRTFVMPSGTRLSPDDLRLMRRTIRDYYTRAHSLEATLNQWTEVCRAEATYITPYINKADYHIDSSFEYELFVYKHCLKSLMEDCRLEAYSAIRSAMAEVREIPLIHIPANSLLNEFAILK